jgi:hypothetical protein
MPNERKELTTVHKSLELAAEYRLEAEIVWSAVKIAKERPKEDFHQIFAEALCDWDL